MRKIVPLLGVLFVLQACTDLGVDLSEPADQPPDLVSTNNQPPAPPAEPAAPISLAPAPAVPDHPPVTLPIGTPITLKEAERMATRFRTLHQLAMAGLIETGRYQQWVQQNQGAFLLLTAAPPMDGLTAKTPPFDQIAEFLRNLKNERAEIADAERSALLDSLMPTAATRAPPRSPPTDAYGLQSWIALLDQIGSEGLLPADAIAAEKAALSLAVGP